MNTDPYPKVDSPLIRLKRHSVSFLISLSILMVLLLASCVSTSVDGPKPPSDDSEYDIVLSLKAPVIYSFPTRAEADIHAGHQLRYTVKLYDAGTSANHQVEGNDKNLVRKVEHLAKNGNKIVFSGVKAQNYFFTVFADYIDENAKMDSDGHYPDKYYRTVGNQDAGSITLLASDETVLNNHNLDCFRYFSDTFNKQDNIAKAFDITLKRCVSRIQLMTTDAGSLVALKDVTVSNCGARDNLKLGSGSSAEAKDLVTAAVTVPVADRDSGILFFYYTFPTSGGLNKTVFTLNPNAGYEFKTPTWNVPDGRIKSVTVNTIYKVESGFVTISERPSTSVDIKVTTDTSWEESSQTVPSGENE